MNIIYEVSSVIEDVKVIIIICCIQNVSSLIGRCWLNCETTIEAEEKVVTSLKGRVCSKCKDKIIGRKRISPK